jgi:PPOX class probable F420-dependent enzyme
MASIPDNVKDLSDRNVIVHLATINGDGSPQVSPLWIEREGDLFRISTAEGRVKLRNLRRDPRLGLSFTDPEDPGKMIAIQGRAVAIEQRGWDLIDRLAQRYWGTDGFPRIEGMIRVDIDIEVDRVAG